MVSRVLGYIRDSLNAALFGAGSIADAYFVAFRIPNMLRDLVGEGALSAAVIPAVTKAWVGRGPREAFRLVSALLSVIAMGSAVVVLLGWLAAPAIVKIMAPGFAALPGKFALTVSLTRILFPFIAFISLASGVMGLLLSRERLGPVAFAPVALNLTIIAAGAVVCPLLGPDPARQVYAWTAGVVLGGLVQWLVQVPAARELGFRFRFSLWHPGLSSIAALMVPAVIGLAITQVHLLVNTILASLLPEGSVAYLYYGNRLMQLPLGVVGVALSMASYPLVARALARGRAREAGRTVNHALSLVAFAVLPASAGLMALSQPINGLLFRFGRFTSADASQAAAVASAYAIGILGHSCLRVLTPPFYAAGRPYVPVITGGVGVLANILLSSWLMLKIGVIALPLSTSLVTLLGAFWLAVRLRDLVPGVGGFRVAASMGRSLLASAAMGWGVFLFARWLMAGPAVAGLPAKAGEALVTGAGIALGAALYAGFCILLGSPELRDLKAALGRRRP
jgi:putative peptidoglycan lipid II flippase